MTDLPVPTNPPPDLPPPSFMNPLEKRIQYKFRNSLHLAEALTHPSLGHETQRHHFDNQRLEFLGDAVLQLIFTEHLFARFPSLPEGELTKMRSRLVSREGLKVHAVAIGLGEYLMMGRGEESSGGRLRASALSDAFEALIGAMYLAPNALNWWFKPAFWIGNEMIFTVRDLTLFSARPWMPA